MKVTITIGSRVAIPVRALPFVTGLMATPIDIARELAEENGQAQFESYWADGAEEITSRQWGPVYDALEDLVASIRRNGLQDNEHRQAVMHKAVMQLPAGAFVWADRFEHWFSTTYMAKDTVWEEQHLVIGEDEDPAPQHWARQPSYSIDLSPIIPQAFQALMMEGFEPGEYAAMLAANRIEVDDFLSLTGLTRIGDYGLYHIGQDGVCAIAEDWDLYAPGITLQERKEIQSFIKAAKLDFPCAAERLVDWVNGVNWDFELPIRFVRAVAEKVLPAAHAKSAPDREEKPAGHLQQLQTESLVAWHQSMVLHWPGIMKKYGNNGKMPTARQITTYLTDFDTDGCVVSGPDKKRLYWHPLAHGPKDEPKPVSMKTILNVRKALMGKGLLKP